MLAFEKSRMDKRRYAVLDALRFVLALWVTIGHFETFPLFAGVNEATPIGQFLYTRGSRSCLALLRSSYFL